MSTILTVTGKRGVANVVASANFVLDSKLDRDAIFVASRTMSHGIDKINVTVDDVSIDATPGKEWAYTHDGKKYTVARGETQKANAKKNGLPLNEETRDFGPDVLRCVTGIVREHFPAIAPVSRGGGSSTETKAVLKSQLDALTAALAAAGKSDQEIAELLQSATISDDKSQNATRKNAKVAEGQINANDVPSKKA